MLGSDSKLTMPKCEDLTNSDSDITHMTANYAHYRELKGRVWVYTFKEVKDLKGDTYVVMANPKGGFYKPLCLWESWMRQRHLKAAMEQFLASLYV